MIFSLIDKKLRKAFSDADMQYDVLASLQKEIGRELVKKIESLEDSRYILDAGMGTGWMTHRLSNLFPEAKVIGLDAAWGMIEQACKKYEGLRTTQADARQLPFKKEIFDVVISNLAYQWMIDLEKAFAEVHHALKDNGVFCLTMFGRETLSELFTAIDAVEGKNFLIERLAGREEIENALKKTNFCHVDIETEMIKVHFPDMLALMKWLKDIGANILPKNGFIGKEVMFEASEFYKKNFSDRLGIIATFEVIWIKTQK